MNPEDEEEDDDEEEEGGITINNKQYTLGATGCVVTPIVARVCRYFP